VTWVGTEPIEARTVEALNSGHIRFHEMQVLCGVCGGPGCEHCTEPAPPPTRWQRFLAWLTREAGS
jgi:hypothetical protein